MNEEIEKLEVKVSYLERENALLGEEVIELNKRLSTLSLEMEEIKKKVVEILLDEGEERESRRPPHY